MSDVSLSLDLDAKQLYQELQNVSGKFVAFAQKTEETSQRVSKSGGGFGAGFGKAFAFLGGTAAITGALRGIVDYGDRVKDLSQRFGVSAVALQQFGNAAGKNGSSLEAVAMGFNKLEISRSKALGGDERMIATAKNLGLTFDDLKSKSPDQLMNLIGHSAMNAADMVKFLGKGALELRPTLAGLSDGTIEYGKAISDIDVTRLDEASDTFKTLKEDLLILGGSIVGPFVSAWKQGINSIITLLLSLHQAEETIINAGIKLMGGDFKGAKQELKQGAAEVIGQITDRAAENRKIAEGKQDLAEGKVERKFGGGEGGGDGGEATFDEDGEEIGDGTPRKSKKGGASADASARKREENQNKIEENAIRRSGGDVDSKLATRDIAQGLVAHALAVDPDAKLEQEAKISTGAVALDKAGTAAADKQRTADEKKRADAEKKARETKEAADDSEKAKSEAKEEENQRKVEAAQVEDKSLRDLADELGKSPEERQADRKAKRRDDNLMQRARAQRKDEADRRRRGAYLGHGYQTKSDEPGSGLHSSGLTSSGLTSTGLSPKLSDDDWHAQFKPGGKKGKRSDGRLSDTDWHAQFQSSRAQQVKTGMDHAYNQTSNKPHKEALTKTEELLEAIRENTGGLGKNK